MKALVLGGTRFVGAAIVSELVRRGAEVTLLTRGQTNPERFAELDNVHGDRATDLDRLGDRSFDAVFDSCGYTPDVVASSAAACAGTFYVFVSSASAYARSDAQVLAEDAPLAVPDEAFAIDAIENYGAAKVLCEAVLSDHFGSALAILRAGLVAGPGDYTDRFPYWVARLSRSGEVLCPGDGLDPTQLIDARDLATFAVDLAESRTGGCFNVSGPAKAATFADLLDAIGGARATRRWAPAEFLETHNVSPWGDMPCWLPRDHTAAPILRLDLTRALANGLTHRPLAETAADTRAWLEAEQRDVPMLAGLAPERERELLELLSRAPTR